jgi:diaminohydroxyphosphoribosylaminopyrimidine deaminase/5-amino-6-(5-phosphoribosylamino)uracil reductase
VEGKGSDLDLEAVLRVCRGIGITSILCEGGARLAGSLLRQRRAGRLYLIVAPRALGDGALPAFGPRAEDLPWDDYRRSAPPEAWGDDTLIVLDRKEI